MLFPLIYDLLEPYILINNYAFMEGLRFQLLLDKKIN